MIKTKIYSFLLCLLASSFLVAQNSSYRVDFLLVDEFGKTIDRTYSGENEKLFPVGPTFHLFTSLVALKEGVIENENSLFTYKCPTATSKKNVKCSSSLKEALHKNDLFYFLQLEEKIKHKKLKQYVESENYGNEQLPKVWSEIQVEGDGLKISPEGQIAFLRKIKDKKYKSNFGTVERTIVEKLLESKDSLDYNITYFDGGIGSINNFHDWNIGWIKQNGILYYFALHLQFSEITKKTDLQLKHQLLREKLLDNHLLDFKAIEEEKQRRDSVLAVRADTNYSLKTFFRSNPNLDSVVNAYYEKLNLNQKVGQLIMPAAGRWGIGAKNCENAIKEGKVGGFLMLKGEYKEVKALIQSYQKLAKDNNQLPLLMSSDAEPSLINRKIDGFPAVQKTNQLTTSEANKKAATTIAAGLKDLGIHYNFAPDCDLGVNKAIIGNRSYGVTNKEIAEKAWEFSKIMQDSSIVATAKHFPGHGLVKGDSHKNLVFVDGELKEIDTYKPLIDSGVVSVMIGHIAVKNNKKWDTKGEPSSISSKIITDYLRKELGFEGVVVTDGMGMGGVVAIPNSISKAVDAGCDIILMPNNANAAHKEILDKYKADKVFREKVEIAAKRVIRLKVCLGLI